jgi:hypothetical protein
MRLWRRDEPPGIWRGRPRIGAKWKAGGTTYVLVSVSTDASRVVLEYQERSTYQARYTLEGPEQAILSP